MAWTVANALEIYLAETGSMEAALTNAKLILSTAADADLVTITLTATGSGTGNVVLSSASTPATGAGDAANARILSSGDTPYLTGATVSTTGADINFAGGVTFAIGGGVDVADFTLNMSSLTMA